MSPGRLGSVAASHRKLRKVELSEGQLAGKAKESAVPPLLRTLLSSRFCLLPSLAKVCHRALRAGKA